MTESDSSLPQLKAGRAHEAFGAGAVAFACVQAAWRKGPVIWLREGWRAEALHPAGVAAFFDPSRLLLAKAKGQLDILACAEEALRDGSVPFVVLEVPQVIGLTEGRRLQLAARAGRSTALALIAQDNGSNAAETRWHCTPRFDAEADSTLSRWKLIKNKSGTLGSWDVRWQSKTRRLCVVSPSGNRQGAAPSRLGGGQYAPLRTDA